MVGGAKFQAVLSDWSKQSHGLFMGVLMVALIVWAAFADKVPELWRLQLSTTLGRLLLLVVLYIIHEFIGFLPALLFAICIGLTWATTDIKAKEGFSVKVTNVTKNRWLVEDILKENPKRIIEDRIITEAVQDDKGTRGRSSR